MEGRLPSTRFERKIAPSRMTGGKSAWKRESKPTSSGRDPQHRLGFWVFQGRILGVSPPPPTCAWPLLSGGGPVSNRSGAVLTCVIAVRKWGEPLQSSGIPAKNCDIAVRNSDIAVRNRDVAVLKWEGGLLKWAPPLRRWVPPHFGSEGERPF